MLFLKKAAFWCECFITWIVASVFRCRFDRQKYRFNIPEIWYSPWNKDESFSTVHAAISNNTLVSKRKLFDLFSISRQFKKLSGDYLEIGTLRGGTAGLLASTFAGDNLVLWDNWGKHVDHDNYLIQKNYSESYDLERTKSLILQIAPDTFNKCLFINNPYPCKSTIANWNKRFSLVHFDIYDKTAFEEGIDLIWPLINNGGVFIVSAYGSISLDPLTNSVNSFVKKQEDCFFIQSQSGLGLIFKKNIR